MFIYVFTLLVNKTFENPIPQSYVYMYKIDKRIPFLDAQNLGAYLIKTKTITTTKIWK